MPLAAVALVTALAGTATSIQQGRRQERQAKRALERQERAQSVARSASASERLAQAAESKRMRQRKPDASKIMAQARQKRMAGETFLTGPAGLKPLGSTRYVG
jgi:hypothetical protein